MATSFPSIKKPSPDQMAVRPNLNYDDAGAGFKWAGAFEVLDWLPGGWLNKAHEAIDCHANGRLRDKVALIWEGKYGERERYTFGQLKTLTNRFANVLKSLGVERGDRVFVLMDRLPELYVCVFGILKVGAIAGPLFSGFGPDPVRVRLKDSGAKILITQPAFRRRMSRIILDLFDLQHIITVNKNNRDPAPLELSDLSYDEEMSKAPADFETAATSQYDYSVVHYTAGTAGKPKGAVHRHQAIVQQRATGRWVLDLHDDDTYWCTEDPGSVAGTSYGMMAPWANGVTQLIHEGDFGASACFDLIQKHKVTVWCTAPTAIHMLMQAGDEVAKRYDLSSLRHICSVSGRLSPQAVVWGQEVLGRPFHDSWLQTETGTILVANYPGMDIRPGSTGRPVPGIEVGILDQEHRPVAPGSDGNLALRPGWPSMFDTYWNDPAAYNARFRNGWYTAGEHARMDEQGYLSIAGRADDAINVAGHLVGPLEVEGALIEHPAVAEAGVVGQPDPIAMEVVKAFVALKDGYDATDELREDITRFCREKLGAVMAPSEIEFVRSLPKTREGKVMRALLKSRVVGPSEGKAGVSGND